MRWLIARTNEEYVNYLSVKAKVSPVTAQILINRNIRTPEAVRTFLTAGINSLSDPYELSGMGKAVKRIMLAIEKGESILIHGDYDADGVTATAILYETLLKLHANVDYFIPSRFEHGYGFHENAVEMATGKKISLIITVDCGITSFSTVGSAVKKGIDVIITDHHEPRTVTDSHSYSGDVPLKFHNNYVLPEAYVIINPKVDAAPSEGEKEIVSSDFDVKNLSGAGISLKLSSALLSGDITALLGAASIGTLADMVPLTGENRIIVREGIKQLYNKTGIKAMINVLGLHNKHLSTDMLPFTIIPRINAAGRMDNASDVVKLLVSESDSETEMIATWLNKLNSERQRVEERVLNSAYTKIKRNGFDRVIVVSEEKWHEGVLGIVASRIVEKYNVPAFVFTIKNGEATGSARSVQGFDICKAIACCSDFLIRFGGHKQAAGLKLDSGDLPLFEKKLNTYVKSIYGNSDFIRTINIDANVKVESINFDLLKELSSLSPHGFGNPEPLMGSKGLTVRSPRVVGKNHLKMKIGRNGSYVDAIAFDQADSLYMVSTSENVDAVYTPVINEWEGNRMVQLNVKALRRAVKAHYNK